MAGNFLVQTIPFTQVKEWERRGSTGDADAAPYVSIAYGGWQWCFYGIFSYALTRQDGFLILVQSNFLGAVFGTYYTYCFFRYCSSKENVACLMKYLGGIACLILTQVLAISSLPFQRSLLVSGAVSSFVSFIGAISMLVTVPAVVRQRDSSSIPGLLVVAYFLSSLAWCVCGYMIHDLLVAGPNVVACLSCLTCMFLKLKYPEVQQISDADIASAIQELESLMEKDTHKLGRLALGRNGLVKVGEPISEASGFATWLRNLAAGHPKSEPLGPFTAKEGGFHFRGASGYAGGCATYGSAGTGGTF